MVNNGGPLSWLSAAPRAKGEPMDRRRQSEPLFDNKYLREADRLRAEWKEASFRASLDQYGSAVAYFRSKGDMEGEARALLGLGEVLAILGEYPEALKQYRRGLKVAESAGEIRLQADILNRLTEVEIEEGSPQRNAHAQRALDLAERADHRSVIAWAAKNLGVIAFIKPDYMEAKGYLSRALSLWKEEGDLAGQSEAFVNLGYVHAELGDLRQAGVCFQEAQTLGRAAGNLQKEARATLAIALAHTAGGEFQDALDLYRSGIATLRRVGHKETLTVALNGLANLYEQLGDSDRALAGFSESRRLLQRMGHRGRESVTLGHIARIQAATGRKHEALKAHLKRLRIARSLPDARMEAYALNDAGLVYESLGKAALALECYKKALAISRRLHQPRVLARSLHNLGAFHSRHGRLREARARYEEALPFMVKAGDRAGEGLIRFDIARLERDTGEIEAALRDILAIIESSESRRSNVVSSDLRTSYSASVYRHHELLVDLLMLKHGREPNAGHDVAAFQASEVGRARNLIEMLVEAGADIRRDVPAELIDKENALTKQLSRMAAEEIRLREVKFNLEQARPRKGENRARAEQLAQNKREIDSVTREIIELKAQLEELTAQIVASSPEKYRALFQPRRVDLKELQERLLDDETLVLEFSLGEERSYQWVVGRDFLKSRLLPGRAEIERQAADFYRAMTAPATAADKSPGGTRRRPNVSALNAARDRLSRTLLGPIAGLIGSKRLVIVAEGALQYVPFGALKEPGTGELLIVRHEVVNLPSLSVLLELQRETFGRAAAPRTLAIIADPVVEEGDPRLTDSASDSGGASHRGSAPAKPSLAARSGRDVSPVDVDRSPISLAGAADSLAISRLLFSDDEARRLSNLLPEGERRVWTGFEANRDIAMDDELGKYRIIHFATHGVLNFRFPRLSCLVLSRFDKTGRPRDGYLRLQDIYRMKLPADLVVLSACQSALGKDVRGEGLVGLTRGFIYAGARRVVASLWNIDDRASSVLMERFYRKMLVPEKLRPAAALRAAQIEMMSEERWQDPFLWAAFVIQGDWK